MIHLRVLFLCLECRYVYELVTAQGHFFPNFTSTGVCDTGSLCVEVQTAASTRSTSHVTVTVAGAFDANDQGPLYMRLLVRTGCFTPACMDSTDQYYPISDVTDTKRCQEAAGAAGSSFPRFEQCFELTDLVQVGWLVGRLVGVACWLIGWCICLQGHWLLSRLAVYLLLLQLGLRCFAHARTHARTHIHTAATQAASISLASECSAHCARGWCAFYFRWQQSARHPQ